MNDEKIESSNLHGLDVLKWTVGEKRSSVCAAPFSVTKGNAYALQKFVEGLSSSPGKIKGLFRTRFVKKKYDVKPDNFAKINCWIARSDVAIAPVGRGEGIGEKQIHCDGINIEGVAINPLAVAGTISASNLGKDPSMGSNILSRTLADSCNKVLTTTITDNPKLYLTQENILTKKYPEE